MEASLCPLLKSSIESNVHGGCRPLDTPPPYATNGGRNQTAAAVSQPRRVVDIRNIRLREKRPRSFPMFQGQGSLLCAAEGNPSLAARLDSGVLPPLSPPLFTKNDEASRSSKPFQHIPLALNSKIRPALQRSRTRGKVKGGDKTFRKRRDARTNLATANPLRK